MADDPIRERILQHCATSLLAINGTGAYHTALETIQRGQPVPDESITLPAAFLDEGTESYAQDTNLLITRQLPVGLDIRLRSDVGNLPTLANRALADAERALTADPTRGGLAKQTEMTGSAIVMDEAPGVLANVHIDFVISYMTRRGDPASNG